MSKQYAPVVTPEDVKLIVIYRHSLTLFGEETLWWLEENETSPIFLAIIRDEIEARLSRLWKNRASDAAATVVAFALNRKLPIDLRSACDMMTRTADEVEAR